MYSAGLVDAGMLQTWHGMTPTICPAPMQMGANGNSMRSFRTLRILRSFRVLRVLKVSCTAGHQARLVACLADSGRVEPAASS